VKTPHDYSEITAMFGNPANGDGTVNAIWEEKNIRKIAPPAGWQLFYKTDNGPVKVSGIRMHRLLKGSFQTALRDIWAYAREQAGASAAEEDIRAWLNENRLDLHGGGYNFRPKRGGSGLSLHSYGIAIDWDPVHNPRKNPMEKTLPDWWYDIWQNNGWHDGRRFSTPDSMHVQFATGA